MSTAGVAHVGLGGLLATRQQGHKERSGGSLSLKAQYAVCPVLCCVLLRIDAEGAVMEVVPVALTALTGLSTLRIAIPADLRSADARRQVRRSRHCHRHRRCHRCHRCATPPLPSAHYHHHLACAAARRCNDQPGRGLKRVN